MTIQQWITEAEMYEYSAEHYEMTKLIGEIELYEMAIRSHDLLMSDTVYTEGVDILNLFSEAEDGEETTQAVERTKETLWDKIKKVWEWICDKFSNMWDAIVSFFTGKSRNDANSKAKAGNIMGEVYRNDYANASIDPDDVKRLVDVVKDMSGRKFGNKNLLAIYKQSLDTYDSQRLDDLMDMLERCGVDRSDIDDVKTLFAICDKRHNSETYAPAYISEMTSMSDRIEELMGSTDIKYPEKIKSAMDGIKVDWQHISDKFFDRQISVKEVRLYAIVNNRNWEWVPSSSIEKYLDKSVKSDMRSARWGALKRQFKYDATKELDGSHVSVSSHMAELQAVTLVVGLLLPRAIKEVNQTTRFENLVIDKCRIALSYIKGIEQGGMI